MHNVGLNGSKSAAANVTRRVFIRTVATAGTPQKLTTFTSVSIVRNGSTVTATVSGLAPYLVAGDEVVLSGAASLASGKTNPINGKQKVKGTTSTTFTFDLGTVPDGMADTDTVTVVASFRFQKAFFIGNNAARTANTGTVWHGPTAAAGSQPYAINPGEVHDIAAPVGCVEDLQDYYLDVGTNADGIVILWV